METLLMIPGGLWRLIIQQMDCWIAIPLALLELKAIQRILSLPIPSLRNTNHYARAKIAARESACPDKIHHPWVDVMLEEMMAFLGLVINISLIHKGDVRGIGQVTFQKRLLFSK